MSLQFAVHADKMGYRRNAYKILEVNLLGNCLLGKDRRRWG
jgi:hypothetical protein